MEPKAFIKSIVAIHILIRHSRQFCSITPYVAKWSIVWYELLNPKKDMILRNGNVKRSACRCQGRNNLWKICSDATKKHSHSKQSKKTCIGIAPSILHSQFCVFPSISTGRQDAISCLCHRSARSGQLLLDVRMAPPLHGNQA